MTPRLWFCLNFVGGVILGGITLAIAMSFGIEVLRRTCVAIPMIIATMWITDANVRAMKDAPPQRKFDNEWPTNV